MLELHQGDLGPGVHIGVITGAPGAWAEQLAAHDSMLFPVPDGISDEAAVLADPFAVSFHAIVRHPPPTYGRVLVYGRRAGPDHVAILRAIYPEVKVACRGSFEARSEMAQRFGASAVFAHEPRLALVEALTEWSGAVLHVPLDGLPVTHPGHVDVVSDSVAKAGTLEVGMRCWPSAAARLHRRGHPRAMGVHSQCFKEITVAGRTRSGWRTSRDTGGMPSRLLHLVGGASSTSRRC